MKTPRMQCLIGLPRFVNGDAAAQARALDRAPVASMSGVRRAFGDAAYAIEELVAELGAAFLMRRCGRVEATIEGRGDLEAWFAVRRKDCTAIFTATRHASDALDLFVARVVAGSTRCEVDGRRALAWCG